MHKLLSFYFGSHHYTASRYAQYLTHTNTACHAISAVMDSFYGPFNPQHIT